MGAMGDTKEPRQGAVLRIGGQKKVTKDPIRRQLATWVIIFQRSSLNLKEVELTFEAPWKDWFP